MKPCCLRRPVGAPARPIAEEFSTFPMAPGGRLQTMYTVPKHSFHSLRRLIQAGSTLRLFRQLTWLAVVLAGLFMSALCTGAADTVPISEVVSRNSGGLADEDNETPDWIELFNSGASAVNLAGLDLPGDSGGPHKQAFV